MPDIQSNAGGGLLPCPMCGARVASRNIYADATWRGEIMRQTPMEVWEMYRAEGISLLDAVRMEMSYAG